MVGGVGMNDEYAHHYTTQLRMELNEKIIKLEGEIIRMSKQLEGICVSLEKLARAKSAEY